MRTSLLCAFLTGASLLAQAQRPLVVRGEVTSAMMDEQCSVTLMTACGDTLLTEMVPNGRFHYRLHRNASYILRFAQDGSVTKEIVVDAAQLPRVRKVYLVRRIEFDVRMEAGDPQARLRYASPAGYINTRGGRMQVLYDRSVEAEVDPEPVDVIQ